MFGTSRTPSVGGRRRSSRSLGPSGLSWLHPEFGAPPAFRGYFDMPRGVELGARHLFDAGPGFESDADDLVRLRATCMGETHWPARPLFRGHWGLPSRAGRSFSAGVKVYRFF